VQSFTFTWPGDCRINSVMRWRVIIAAIALTAVSAAGAVQTRKHPYRRMYKRRTFGKKALAGVAGGAAISRRPGGLGSHLASGMATHVVKNSIQYPIAATRHEDLRYHRSTRKGFRPRVEHALASTVVTRKTTTGKKTVAAGGIAGAMGSGLLLGGGVASGGTTLGAAAGVNVAREFWPRKKGHRRQKKRK
jgi:hypothetical protein